MLYGKFIGASMIAIGMGLAAPAMAATSAPAPAKEEAAQASFTDEQLASFAAAHEKVEALNKQYSARANGATDEAARKQVTQLKNIDLADAVKSEGLTTAEYNQIYMATKADPALAAKVASMKGQAEPDTKIQ
ncbi:DUF4168 domain-containing protein [Emcibacter sp. SYSU 3D8]|uniref:DUF4168 domain-containing protein n=1 Tax=Emcibacter sp. SYSU 3D8 TaxID=3133969 RepID=UPI0031FF08C4